MQRVLIVDDHAIVREGVKAILQRMGFVEIQEAATALEALEFLRNAPFDLVIQDLNLPGMDGFELLDQIHRLWKALPVLVLSIYSEQQYALRALHSGASGYVSKNSISAELEIAVRKAISAGKYVSSALAERLAWSIAEENDRRPHERLTDREFQVMRLILDGQSLSTIGRELNLSVKTVSTHRARILKKLDLKTTVDLVRYAIKHDLCD